MTVLAQFALFLSSYAPLFAVFALLDSFGSGLATTICILLAVAGPLLAGIVFIASRRLVAPQELNIQSAQARDGDALAYLATYLVPFAAVSATTTRERLALALFIVLIAVLYVRSQLFYVNPLLALIGYRLFQVSTPKGATVVLLTRRSFVRAGITVSARRLSDYVYWE